MWKFIAPAVAATTAIGGGVYGHITTLNATIESQQRAVAEVQAQADAAKTQLNKENQAIDHIMGELRDLQGVNAK
jgi:hypothetical protein